MKKQTRKDLETLMFQPDDFFTKLSETEKKSFLADCSVVFGNPSFKQVCNEIGTQQILYTAKEAVTAEDLAYGRGKINGVATLFEAFAGYHSLYLQNIKKEEDFDANAVI